MIKKHKKSVLTIFLIITFIICCILIKHTNINVEPIAQNTFLFTYLGIFLGFALTIFTFIVSMVDKIKDEIEKDEEKTNIDRKNTQKNILSFYSEIKQDIFLIFFFFIVVTFISLFENVDIPLIKIFKDYYISKIQIITSIKLEIFILSIIAIYDLTSSAFKISEATGIFRLKDKDN